MSRLMATDPDQATGMTKELFDLVKGRMGMVPNIMSMLANSPAALSAYLGFNAGLRHASIGSELCELIALTVSGENKSAYCISLHSFIGTAMGMDERALKEAQYGVSSDPEINTVLHFVKEVLRSQGAVSDAALQKVKAAGYTEGQIVEIMAQISLSIFTNYVNIVASTDIDYPIRTCATGK
ncbi:carboxymuconolactone decarboxylase family protein [Chitinophaga filiformis]|uniref:Carboxymuconolactone decarboxylase family protein n=1 Tax=Chitinophaga filiformis TaxID=104663 RepID=A0ABY4HZ30_CHIFI|nr:carboxymuconolactone decarboxylase family protein [Chitinophaga filiformis]UPK68837.1 carboxymuconolactone decarboxylase family protein [Chitinophaga filiformis]